MLSFLKPQTKRDLKGGTVSEEFLNSDHLESESPVSYLPTPESTLANFDSFNQTDQQQQLPRSATDLESFPFETKNFSKSIVDQQQTLSNNSRFFIHKESDHSPQFLSSLKVRSKPASPTKIMTGPHIFSHTGVPMASSRSLPTSRRSSIDLTQKLWSGLESLSIGNPRNSLLVEETSGDEDDIRDGIPRNKTPPHRSNASEVAKINVAALVDSPYVPPLQNDRFLLDGEKRDVHYKRKKLFPSGDNREFQFRRDESDVFPRFLSARSAALDLASLPQKSPPKLYHDNSDYILNKHSNYHQVSPPNFSTSDPSTLEPVFTTHPESQEKHHGFSNIPPQSTSRSVHQNQYLQQQQQQQQKDYEMPQSMPLPGSNTICRFYRQGFCSRGDRCFFLHTTKTNTQVPMMKTSIILAPLVIQGNCRPGGVYGYGGSSQHLRPPPSPQHYRQQPQHQFEGDDVFMAAGYFGGHHQASSTSHLQQQREYYGNLYMQASGAVMFNKQMKNNNHEFNRFENVPFQDLVGRLFDLCQDQHGCRYLQKILDQRKIDQLNIIFQELHPHFTLLMTNPFGNYLCQRLIEHCSEDQRSLLTIAVASHVIKIALNTHGTRAVQKMIDYLDANQVQIFINALAIDVVVLAKDLNGNHVIQKCLNRLTVEQNQFIYNAISKQCIEVSTHRHGCCVLQRCIDHGSEAQRIQLINEITYNVLTLVKDPYGNYVVQYVLDLDGGVYADPLIRRFIGNVCKLSVQKFSSNVIEKCIRVSYDETRRLLVEELLDQDILDQLLNDGYANYVVQTALDFCDSLQRIKMVECMKSILPNIRHTLHGKRIFNKIFNFNGGVRACNY